MFDTIIEQLFIHRIVSSIVVIGVLFTVLFFVRWALKNDDKGKWFFTIGLCVSIVVIIVLGVGLSEIYLDIKNEDYVTYCGEYIERGGGQKDLKTVVVYDEKGKEIRLLRTGPSEEGIYEGTVIYGRRSKIIVEYDGVPKA